MWKYGVHLFYGRLRSKWTFVTEKVLALLLSSTLFELQFQFIILLQHANMLEKIPAYSYDQQIEKWVKATPQSDFAKSESPLRIATFNVLTDNFPWFIELCIQSEKRFKATCKMIEDLDFDIIGFNEVTSTFLAELMENKTIRSRYYFSDINIAEKTPGWFNHTANKSLGKRMGNMILSKIPFAELYRVSFDSQKAKATR